MGEKAREIVNLDVSELLSELNKAYADEWFAYYQYWIGSLLAKGPLRGMAAGELAEHAGDELDHARRLAERIIQLGGDPVKDPADWSSTGNCGYLVPEDVSVPALIEQAVQGEQCAIDHYNKLLDRTHHKDAVTYALLVSILEEELEHEEEFQSILDDLGEMQREM
jgi:bacterioferritin